MLISGGLEWAAQELNPVSRSNPFSWDKPLRAPGRLLQGSFSLEVSLALVGVTFPPRLDSNNRIDNFWNQPNFVYQIWIGIIPYLNL
jgi:hypothetical protein